jgi:hypothetical protein
MRPFTQPNIESLIRTPVARVDQRETELAEMTDKLVHELCSETLEIVAPKSLRDTLADRLRRCAFLSTARHMDCYIRIMELREATLATIRIARTMEPPVPATASPEPRKAPKAAKVVESDEGPHSTLAGSLR